MISKYLSKIARLTSGTPLETANQRVVGYLALTEMKGNKLPRMAPGLILDNKTEAPPWHIIEHDLRTMTIPNWPVSLWRVQAIRPIKPQGHRGNYTRCSAIKVLEGLPSYLAFGETDKGVVDVIELAQTITLKQAQALSELRASNAPEINSKVWAKWIRKNGILRDGYTQDFDDVLSIGRSVGDSPIRSGLLLISRVLFDQAGRVDAEKAYAHAEDGTPFLSAPWDEACSTLKDAALSFGASELFDADEIVEMRKPLQHVFPDLVKMIEEKIQK